MATDLFYIRRLTAGDKSLNEKVFTPPRIFSCQAWGRLLSQKHKEGKTEMRRSQFTRAGTATISRRAALLLLACSLLPAQTPRLTARSSDRATGRRYQLEAVSEP